MAAPSLCLAYLRPQGLHPSLLVWAAGEGGDACLSPSGEGWEAAESSLSPYPVFLLSCLLGIYLVP